MTKSTENDTEKNLALLEPTPSNSRLKVSDLRQSEKNGAKNADKIRVSIDRLTVVGTFDFSEFDFYHLVRKWRDETHFIEPTGDGWQVLDYSTASEDIEPEQVAYFHLLKYDLHKVRVDFNPNHSMHSAAGRWVVERLIASMRDKHFSRCDVAFDMLDLPEIADYRLWRFGVSKQLIYGQSGKLETAYWGKRSSESQIRLYDKKTEQAKRHGEIVNLDSWWRLELQLRGPKVADYPGEVQKMLESFYAPDFSKLDSINNKMAVCGLVANPDLWGELSRASRHRYHKLLKECKPDNGLSVDLAQAFVDQYQALEYTLQSMMHKFHIDASEQDV